MPLTEDEIELLARQRMLKNVLNEVMGVLQEADPQRAQEVDEALAEYVDEARRQCADAGDTDRILECIMDVKQERESEIRDRMQSLS